jgi:transcriptional regulator with XRE-family HTH domain
MKPTAAESWFRERRRELGKTIDAVAMECGINRTTVQRWEAFKTLPDLLRLTGLSHAYQATVDDIIREIGEAAKHIIYCQLQGKDPRTVPQARAAGYPRLANDPAEAKPHTANKKVSRRKVV